MASLAPKGPHCIWKTRMKLWIWRPMQEWVLEGSDPGFAFLAMCVITSPVVLLTKPIEIVYLGRYHFGGLLKSGNSSD